MKREFVLCKFALLCVVLVVLASCNKDAIPDPKPDDDQAPRLIQKVNNFIFDVMDEVYLWTALMPRNIDVKYERDPKEYFMKLLYKDEDRWSYITDDYDSFIEGGDGVETTFGYSLAWGRFTGTDYFFGVIRFVYPDTPAARAGLKRGDIIYKANGNYIEEKNYMGLFDDPFISLQMGVLSSGVISPSGAVIDLVAEKMQLSSIIEKKVFDIEGKKIGYLFYSDFFGGSEKELNEVFHWFQEEGVGDVVLDLRYNPGGYVNVATHLSSILAPMDVVNSEKVLVTYQWNAGYQAYWEQEKQYARLRTVFNKSVPVNMNLQRLYVFTTSSSASASELVITGLDPYMEVIKIGGASHGKYTGSSLFRPETYNGKTWEVDQEIKNWGILPIIFRYANSLGITNFKNGFTPDYIVPDLLLEGVQQLGDPNEPFLGKALELISGINFSVHAPTTKSGFEMRVDLLPKKDYFHGSVFVKMD